ncbi:MAG: hypothetical protein ACFFDN_01675 [Candidatus Hodarchaeota archaeon]
MSKVSEKIVESSSFNLLGAYFTFIIGILNTFFIARLLIPNEWAIIILTINFIYICVFICNLFPPNAHDSIKYYIPHITSNDFKENEVKRRSFIYHVYRIRLLSSGIVYILYIIIALLTVFDKSILQIILIMSPIVLFDILKNLNKSVLLAFQRFKKVFFIDIIYSLIVCLGFIIIYIFHFSNPLILIAYIYLLGSLFCCLLSIILVITVIKFGKINLKKSSKYKQDFLLVHKKYGVYLTIADVFTQLTFLIVYFLFLHFDLLIFITWLTICEISVISALYFSSSNPSAYISIFSEINYQKDPETYKANFYRLNKFLMLFICIIVGIMLFFIELYVIVIYSSEYLLIVFLIEYYLFSAFSRIIVRNLFIITQSTNNTKINAIISFIHMIINVIFAIFALMFFYIRAIIILYIISSFLIAYIAIRLVNRKLDLNLKAKIFFKPFLVFLLAYLIVLPIDYFIYFRILPDFYLLNILLNNIIKFLIFAIVFYLIFYFTKTMTKEEFNKLREILPILHSQSNFIQRITRIIERFLPSEKKTK